MKLHTQFVASGAMHRLSALALGTIGIWIVILVGAVLNGAVREAVLLQHLDRSVALFASGVMLCLYIVLISLLLVPKLGRLSSLEAICIGVFWLLMTEVFEFGFGRLVQHRTWSELLEAYTFTGGNIWPIVLFVTLCAPVVAVRLRGRR